MSERLFPVEVYQPRKGESKKALETRLWEPVRQGKFYCAPRCGCGCTWKDFQLATKRAAALCKLLGPGWEPRVWENGRWHYEATKGLAEVHANYDYSKCTEASVSYAVWLQSAVGAQVILEVPIKRDGTSDIKATLKKALALKRKAARAFLAEVEAVEM